jgi:asparaginyl-tRNA synthetase
LIGKNVRLSYLNQSWEKYVDQVVTVTGWARETRLAAKDSLLFVKLIDGSNTEPLQVVIEKTIPNWEDVKKAKIGYSFKLTGKI